MSWIMAAGLIINAAIGVSDRDYSIELSRILISLGWFVKSSKIVR